MSSPKLEEVFRVNGVPTYTFAQPGNFNKLLISLRTPSRGVVVEGPSGIGKTTAVERVLRNLGDSDVTRLSARRAADLDYIKNLPELGNVGTVVVDDFHKLEIKTKAEIADYLKLLADDNNEKTKLIIVGINQAGDSLIRFASDLVNRLNIIRFENNPDSKIRELLAKGEEE